MGRLSMLNGRLVLRFSPTDAAFGKNPGQLPMLEVPHHNSPDFDGFLGRTIQQTKDKLNELSEDQKAAAEEQKWFRVSLLSFGVVSVFFVLFSRASGAGQACKILLNKRATELGFTFDKTAGAYVDPKAAEKEAA